MTPQPQTPLASKPLSIRSHSPYSTGKGPIVNQGFVEARVRAIEGGFRQPKDPSQYPEPQNDGSATRKLFRGIRSLKESPSFQRFSKHSRADTSNNLDNEVSRDGQLSNRRKWQHSTSSLGSPINILPTGLRASKDRKIHSVWDLNAHYRGSPHGGRKRYRDYSNLRKVSDGSETVASEIVSPQPLSPFKQPVHLNHHITYDSGVWSEPHAKQPNVAPPSPRKSIAEELGNIIDVSAGQDEASAAWATEDESSEYLFHEKESPKGQSTSEAQRSDGGVPFDRNAHSQYIARSLPGLKQSRTATDSNDADDELQLRKVRSRCAIPDNTMESLPESAHEDEMDQLLAPKRGLRAATAAYAGRATSPAPRRTILPAPSIDPFIDPESQEDVDEDQRILQDFNASNTIDEVKPSQRDEDVVKARNGSEFQRCQTVETSHSRRSLHSRRSSTTSRAPSTAPPRSFSRVWKRISSWRLGFGMSPASSVEPSLDTQVETPSRTGIYLHSGEKQQPHQDAGQPQNEIQQGSLSVSADSALGEHGRCNTATEEQRHTQGQQGHALSSSSTPPSLDESSGPEVEQTGKSTDEGHILSSRSPTPRAAGGSHASKQEQIYEGSYQGRLLPSISAVSSSHKLDVAEEQPLIRTSSEDHIQRSRFPALQALRNADAVEGEQLSKGTRQGHYEPSRSRLSSLYKLNIPGQEPLTEEFDEIRRPRTRSSTLAASGDSYAEQRNRHDSAADQSQQSVSRSQIAKGSVGKPCTAAYNGLGSFFTPRSSLASSKASSSVASNGQGLKTEGFKRPHKSPEGDYTQSLSHADVSKGKQSSVDSSKTSSTAASQAQNLLSEGPKQTQSKFLEGDITQSSSRADETSSKRSSAISLSASSSAVSKDKDLNVEAYERSEGNVPDKNYRQSSPPAGDLTTASPISPLVRSSGPPPVQLARLRISTENSDPIDRSFKQQREPIHDGQFAPLEAANPTNSASTLIETRLSPRRQGQSIYHAPSVHSEGNSRSKLVSSSGGTPPALSSRRPPLSGACSHLSLNPGAARSTTEVSTPDPINWTPSPSHRRGSVFSRTYNNLADRSQLHSTTHSRASSPCPSETDTIHSRTSQSAYVSLKSSQASPRSQHAEWYELPRYRDREQRIKRVKVVVSLDGGPDLVVDATVQQGRDGEEMGWKVREGVRVWGQGEREEG